MRILVAPDAFAGSLSALGAARAVATGWLRARPGDELVLRPLSDGGPGFVDVVTEALGARLLAVTATGPLGGQVPCSVALHGGTAHVESAQACGLHLVPPAERDAGAASSFGVGQLIGAAVDEGATRVVVGLGGSGCTDGGAGALAALGAEPAAPLRRGGLPLADLDRVDLSAALERVAGVELVVATDVDAPLLGPRGAAAVFGPQKGADPGTVRALEGALAQLARVTRGPVDAPGAGAAGGLGYGLLLLGAHRVEGLATVADAVGLADEVARCDLVITGEGALDASSLTGKVPGGVAALARAAGRPVVALAGRVDLGEDELRAAGFARALALVDAAGSQRAAQEGAAEHLAALAERVAADQDG